MPRISCRFLHPWCLIVPGTALLCATGLAPSRAARPATPHAAMQPAAVVAKAPAAPALALPGPPRQATGRPAALPPPPVPTDAPADDERPAVPARVVLRSESVWATAHVLYADVLGTCIACTSTQAGDNRSSSEARSSRVLTKTGSGGQGPSNGDSGGELVALPPNPLLHLALESWRANSSATPSGSSGHAEAAVVDLGLARPGVLDLKVARSSSDSEFSSRSWPRARSEDDALVAVAGGGLLRIAVLHSEASDHDDGSAQLASVNGIVLLQSGNVVLPDRITVPTAVSLELLHADGDGAAAAAARDGRSRRLVGLSGGAAGHGGTGPVEPLH
jgi:hypothetical protein